MESNYNRRSSSSGSRRSSRRPASNSSQRPATARRTRTTQRSARGREVRSTSIGEINREQKRAARSEKGGGGGRVVIAIAIVVVLLVATFGGYAFARVTNQFPIQETNVVGVEHLTDAEVAQLAQIPENATLLNVDTAAIRSRLLLDTWVKDAKVTVVFPNKLDIVVTEREIAAVVEVGSADSSDVRQWALSSDGMWLMPIPDRDSEAGKNTSSKVFEDADAAMHIINVPYTASPEIGKYCKDSNINNALEIVSGMTTELAGQVKTVSATDPESTTLILEDGVEIAFGTAKDIRPKERVCLQILKENEGMVAYINVRTVDRPTWRSA